MNRFHIAREDRSFVFTMVMAVVLMTATVIISQVFLGAN
jgi:hypothetical protein